MQRPFGRIVYGASSPGVYPHGWVYTQVTEGWLEVCKGGQTNRVAYAVRMVTERRPPSRTKSHVVYEALRAAITSGRFAPGTRLRQEEVAARYSVSQTPVREAFRRLEAEGLVEHAANRGVVVRGDTRQTGAPPPLEMLVRRWSELVDDPDSVPGSDWP